MERVTRQQIWKDMYGNVEEKTAELPGTHDQPTSFVPLTSVERTKKKSVIPKTASAEDMLKVAFASEPDDNEGSPVMGKQPAAAPQATALKPHVDVTGKEPPKPLKRKEAQLYALPSENRYPLDGYDQVKMASAYFDEWYKEMLPSVRHEFCQNMVKRAHDLSIPVSDLASRYAGDGYAPIEHIKVAVDARKKVLSDESQHEVLDKVASVRLRMPPEDFVACLEEFDRMTGLDEFYGVDVPDPYISTFDKLADKQESKADPLEVLTVGNEQLPLRDLILFSKMRQEEMSERFGEDFAKEFTKDPKAIFDSLPRDQKLVIMRKASTSDSSAEGASAA